MVLGPGGGAGREKEGVVDTTYCTAWFLGVDTQRSSPFLIPTPLGAADQDLSRGWGGVVTGSGHSEVQLESRYL
jgi:hypothetical protein